LEQRRPHNKKQGNEQSKEERRRDAPPRRQEEGGDNEKPTTSIKQPPRRSIAFIIHFDTCTHSSTTVPNHNFKTSIKMSNPGDQMAAAADSQVKLFRQIQEEVQKMRNDQQLLMQQQSENEMVKQELSLLDDSSQVYKMIGPVLMKNDTEDAKQTVDQRLELITGEL
jgi:chaperonin cofactor prefoldin